jgi:excisionase family DNA binding protein
MQPKSGEPLKWTTVPKFLEQHRGLVGKTTLHEWIKQGRVPHVRVGRKILLPIDALDRMIVEVGARDV